MSNKATRILIKTGKIVGYVLLGIIGLFAVVWLLIQQPRIQTAITQKVTQNLSEKLGTTFRIDGVDIDFFKTIVLEGIYVEDQRKDTLLYAKKLRVNLGVLSLAGKTITANLIGLEDARVNIYKAKGDTTFNYEFIPAAFASTDTTQQDTTSAGWGFDLLEVNLNDIRLSFRDEVEGSDLRMALRELDLDLETLGLEEQYPKINKLTIDGLRTAFAQSQAESDTLVAAAAETAKLDTLANTARRAVADSLDQPLNQPEDSVKTPFNDSGWRLALNQLNLRNTDIKYDVGNGKPVEQGMDFEHLNVQNLLLEISDIAVDDNDFALNVNNFAFKERSGFVLEQLAMEFEADLPRATLRLEEFRTPNSVLDDGLTIRIPSILKTDQLVQQLELNARFREDHLSTKDAAYLTTALKAYPGLQNRNLYLDGEMSVREGTARMDNLTAKFDDDNYLTLNAVVRDLTNLNETYADISVVPLRTSTGFINSILPAGTLPPEFARVGEINMRADVQGYLRDLTGKLNLQTSAGQIRADFTAGTDTSFQRQNFDGRVNIDKVELDKFLGASSGLGDLTLTADLRGSRNGNNITVPQANVNLQSMQYGGYTYRDIRMRGSYVNELAKAVVNARDPNLQATIEGIANLAPAKPVFSVNADLKEVDLWSLKLYADTITLSGQVQANLTGTDPDAIVGRVAVEDFKAIKPRKTYELDSMVLSLDKRGSVRMINIGSNILNLFAEGEFTLAGLPVAMDLLIKKYFTTYPAEPAQLKKEETIWFDLRINPYPQILEAFVPGLKIHEPITVKGHFASDSSKFTMQMDVPQAGVGSQGVTNLVINANTSEDHLILNAAAAQIHISDSSSIPSPSINANIAEDDMQFGFRLASDNADTRLRLNGRFQVKKDTFKISFLPSEFFLKKQEWTLTENSEVVYAPEFLRVNDLTLRRGKQRIAIDGSSAAALSLYLDSISVADIFTILPAMGYTADGTIHGQAQVENMFATPAVQADIGVDSFKVNQNTVGNIQLLADRRANGWVALNATVLGTETDVRAEGQYHPTQETDNLRLDIVIAQLKLGQFEPFVKEYASMQGNLNADVQVRGSASDPNVNGQITFAGPTTVVPKMLGAPLTLTNQTIRFGDQRVNFDQFTLTDAKKRAAVLNGTVNYADLKKIAFELTFKTDGFQFLNSSYGAAESFYGTANLAADLRINGPLDALRVGGRLNTLEETELYLLTYDAGGAEVTQADYVTFVDKDVPPEVLEQQQEEAENEPAGVGGFSLNARVSVTSDAVLNILLDPLTNDRIRAAGAGDFDVRMTPQGDLTVFGVYTIEEGQYHMNLFNAIKKQFNVREGGTITLNGPPEDAQLDLTAVYELETSVAELLDDNSDNSELRAAQQRVPVGVLINIKGNTEKLHIGFDIEVEQEGTALTDSRLEARLAQIRQDETELNKQVFGLIAFNRFISSEGFFAGGSGGGGTVGAVTENIDKSLSALLSQQLNNLGQDYLGVEISVDVESQRGVGGETGDPFGDRNLGVNLSKSLFNDRISVTVGSSFATGGSGSTQTGGGQNVIGDFTVAYRITPNGSMTMRFFRRSEINQMTQGTTTDRIGASLAHSKSFNTLKQLFTSRSRRKKPLEEKGATDDMNAEDREAQEERENRQQDRSGNKEEPADRRQK